jgi:hypothetical protein
MPEARVSINATLAPCPECREPLIVVNGQNQSQVTFWMRNGQPVMTPHKETCFYRGKELP